MGSSTIREAPPSRSERREWSVTTTELERVEVTELLDPWVAVFVGRDLTSKPFYTGDWSDDGESAWSADVADALPYLTREAVETDPSLEEMVGYGDIEAMRLSEVGR